MIYAAKIDEKTDFHFYNREALPKQIYTTLPIKKTINN